MDKEIALVASTNTADTGCGFEPQGGLAQMSAPR
jgi:hypothetical protein